MHNRLSLVLIEPLRLWAYLGSSALMDIATECRLSGAAMSENAKDAACIRKSMPHTTRAFEIYLSLV